MALLSLADTWDEHHKVLGVSLSFVDFAFIHRLLCVGSRPARPGLLLVSGTSQKTCVVPKIALIEAALN